MIRFKMIQNAHSAKMEMDKRMDEIPIDSVRPNPYQPRKDFSNQGLEDLAQSIKEYGVIQPITVRKIGLNNYELIAGERRLRASKIAGLKFIPAIIINIYDQDSALIAMIENLQREGLHYIEEAEGYYSLIHDHGYTQEELAKKIGKNQSTIANKLRILKLSDTIKNILVINNLTERHARALLRLPDEELQLKVLNQVIDKKYNVKDTETLIERIIQNIQKKNMQKRLNRKSTKRQKDFRIFVNTIKNAVSMINDYGIAAKYDQVDHDDYIQISITVAKR